MALSLSAPFLVAYWPYVVSVLLGLLVTQLFLFLSKSKKVEYIDLDPLQDSVQPEERIPYPYFDGRHSEEEMKKKSLEFYEQMDKRRSVREISSENLPLEVIENIIKTAGTYSMSRDCLYFSMLIIGTKL